MSVASSFFCNIFLKNGLVFVLFFLINIPQLHRVSDDSGMIQIKCRTGSIVVWWKYKIPCEYRNLKQVLNPILKLCEVTAANSLSHWTVPMSQKFGTMEHVQSSLQWSTGPLIPVCRRFSRVPSGKTWDLHLLPQLANVREMSWPPVSRFPA